MNKLPKIKFWKSYEFLKTISSALEPFANLWKEIHKQLPDYKKKFSNLTREKDLLENIIVICKHHNIRCILSSFAHYDFKDDEVSLKMSEGVSIENRNSRELASKYNLPFVDQNKLIPQQENICR